MLIGAFWINYQIMMYSSWCMLHTFDTLYTYITESEVLSMKQFCKCALRAYMAKCLAKARKESNLTQICRKTYDGYAFLCIAGTW